MTATRRRPIDVSEEARRRLSDRLETLLGPDEATTLLRSLSRQGTEKILSDRDRHLLNALIEVLGESEATTLMALLPSWTWGAGG